MVSQNVVLFDDTLGANIAYGAETVDPERLAAAIKAAHLLGRRGGAAGRRRHPDRRERHAPVGRTAPARRDRARHLQGRADPDPRRSDLGAGQRIRTRGAGRARHADGGPHHAGHRAPPVDHRARRPHRRDGAGPRGRSRPPRRTAGRQRHVRQPVPAAVCARPSNEQATHAGHFPQLDRRRRDGAAAAPAAQAAASVARRSTCWRRRRWRRCGAR